MSTGAQAPVIAAMTHRRVLGIAVPIVLGNVTVPLLGIVDTGVIGQLGEAAPIGAVGIGAIILTGIYWIFGFLRMGTTGLTAQARGVGDGAEVAAYLSRALLTGFAAGLAVIILQMPLFWGAFQVSPASDQVESLAREYLRIRIWSAPAAISVFGISGWLIGNERARSVLMLQIWMNGVNILLDLWFVLGLGWGVEGVAFATFLAEWSGLALGLWLCRKAFAGPAWRDVARVLDPVRLRHMLGVNGDILVRTLMLEGAFVSFLFLGSGIGDVTLAANQILLQFLHVTAFALDGFAFAAEALVGQAMGARQRSVLRRAAIMTSQWGIGIVVVLVAGFALAGPPVIDLMTTSLPVQQEAARYLPWMILAPVAGVAAWMFDGIFIGATRTRDMRNAMAVSVVIYALSVAVMLPLFGNHGLWAALMLFFVVRGITLALRYPGLEAAAGQ